MTARNFAKIGEDSIVQTVIVWDSSAPTYAAAEAEVTAFWTMFIAPGSVWRECSTDGSFRGYAGGIGYIWDEELQEFYPPGLPEESEGVSS